MTDGGDFWLKDQLGFEVSAGEGTATVSMVADERHLNPHGSLHGAVVFAIVDTGMGAATMSLMKGDDFCATIEIHTRFLEPVFSGDLRAEVRVVKAGRRVVHLAAEVFGGGDRLVATATGSFAVIHVEPS